MSPMVQRPFILEKALLGYLSLMPQHGYSLYQQLSAREGLGLVWRLKPSQLYALLEKLEAAGLVTSQVQPQDPHPPRRIYSLTEAGQNAYRTWRIEPVERPNQLRQLFFARLYFCLQESSQLAQELIKAQKEVADKWLADLEEQVQNAENTSDFEKSLRKYRIEQVKMTLNWLNDCQAELSKNRKRQNGRRR